MEAIVLELGGTRRELRLDFNAYEALEDGGFDVAQVLEGLTSGAKRFTSIRALLWAMCQNGESSPSLHEVGTWVTGANMLPVLTALGKAIRRDLPPPVEGGADNPPTAAGTGGKSSGLRRARSR